MSQTSQDGAPEKISDISAKKDNKKENKKDKKNTPAKPAGKNGSDAQQNGNGNKNSTNSATSKNTKASVASGGATSGAKQEVSTKDSSKNAKMPVEVPPAAKVHTGSKTEAPSAVGSKDARAPTSAQSAGAKTPAHAESKNRSKEEMPLSDTKHSKAPVRGAEDHSKGLKTTSGPAGASNVAHSSANSHIPDGHAGQNAPSGTLADLKKQRAKRMQDTLASVALKENGKPASVSNASNGDANDRNANNITPRGSQTSLGGDKPERRYSNAQEVVEGEDHRCCVIL